MLPKVNYILSFQLQLDAWCPPTPLSPHWPGVLTGATLTLPILDKNIKTYLQADMALSALYLHNVNHRAAARPSLGQLSGYTFQVRPPLIIGRFLKLRLKRFAESIIRQEEQIMDDNENAPLLRVDS